MRLASRPSSAVSAGSAPCVEQQPRHLHVVAVRRLVQRHEAAALALVGVGSGLEQQPHRLVVVRGARGVHGPHAERVVGVVVGVGPVLEQHAHRLGPAEEGGEAERGEALRRALVDRGGIGGQQLAHAVGAPGGRRLEDAELGVGLEQRVGDLALLVEEREQQHGEAVAVACRGQRPVLAQQLAHGVGVAAGDRGDQRGDARVLGHQRTIPQTRSATSLVKAASRRKSGGLPRDVSEKRDRARLHPHAVAEVGARPGRQLEPQLGLLGQLARQLAGAQQAVGVERVLAPVAGHVAAVVDHHREVRRRGPRRCA